MKTILGWYKRETLELLFQASNETGLGVEIKNDDDPTTKMVEIHAKQPDQNYAPVNDRLFDLEDEANFNTRNGLYPRSSITQIDSKREP